jgi:predicted nucleic acid-binding Zn finger protein
MLQSKDINKISELKNDFTHKWFEPEFIFRSLKCFSFSTLCKSLNPVKVRGYSFECIFSILISLPFVGIKTVNAVISSVMASHIEARKDVFYRLKNNTAICWRMILWLFALKFTKIVKKHGNTSKNNGIRCLVIDDTILEKTGRYLEKISRIFDHVTRRYVLGYKLLLMGYWDGTSFLPVDFSLHREQGRNSAKPYGLKKREYNKQYRKQREKGSHSWDRAKEADNTKVENALKMFWRAISQGLKVDYLLMDSWFTCEAFIDAVKKVKKQTVHLIGMYKIPKTKFGYLDQELTYSQIRNHLGKAKRCRSLRLYYMQARVSYHGNQLTMFFSRQGKNGKWKVFLTTNTELSFKQMIEIYQVRWTIEVFFKESKQLLGLGKCQSNDFDAQIADTTITMIQHMLMTLQYRFEHYESKGKLFEHVQEEIIQSRLNERLWGLFIELLKIIETVFEGIDEMELLERVIENDKANEILSRLLQGNTKLEKAA